MTNVELQKQIDELKEKIELLQSTGAKDGIPKKLLEIQKKAFEKYYGNWDYFYHTDIQICPRNKTFSDYEYLRTGMQRLTNIVYKHGRDIKNSRPISGAIESGADLEEYEEIANFIVDSMVDKIKTLRKRHCIKNLKEARKNE